MIDQVEVSKTTEPLERQRPRLLFHVSSLGPDTVEPMTKFGLLANSPTLTPRLDIATYYSGGDLLTFWYPYKKEVDSGMTDTTQTPSIPVTEEMKMNMLDGVEDLHTDNWLKDAYRKIIKGADTFLPGERLRAAAQLKTRGGLVAMLPEDPSYFVSLYTKDKEGFTTQVRGALEKMAIDFLDPNLTKDILAQDIVQTYVEHNLLNIGSDPGTSRRQLEENLSALETGQFDEPVYERYRTMLIARLQKRLEELPKNN